MTDQTANFDADKIVPTSIIANAARRESDAQADDDKRWVETVLTSLQGRPRKARQALIEALLDGNGSMPLLGLELTNTEKSRQNPIPNEDSNLQAFGSPLLGTIVSNFVENARESSPRRSPKRVCYGKLLHQSSQASIRISQNTASSRPCGCYLA